MKFYKIILSTKQSIEIDEADFNKVSANMSSGNLIKVKQGIFNPSFVVAIIPIQKEVNKKIEGYIDENSGKFIATTYEETQPMIEDGFSDVKRLT